MEQFYIIRGDRSGVFFGEIAERHGREVTIRNARRLWYWDGAASISQLAAEGVSKPGNCRFTVTVSSITILDAIEILPCTEKALAPQADGKLRGGAQGVCAEPRH